MQRIGLLLVPGFLNMSFLPLSVFEVANRRAGEPLYEMHVLSEHGGTVANSFGMEVSTEPVGRDDFDTILISAGADVQPTSPAMIAALQDATRSTRRIASICVATFALGDAGLIDGRRVTTHWRFAPTLQARFPKVRVELDRIFIQDGQIWTSAGMSTGIDLGLGMVESDHGRDLARLVAKGMVIPHWRAGGQSQHSAMLDLDAKTDRIQHALAYAKRNLRASLAVSELAEAASLSPRQFARIFRAETGTSPAKAIETLRVEAALLMIQQGRLNLETVAKETGFGDRERMRRAFVRAYGQPPQAMRGNATQPGSAAPT
jgi:transcriptional regulator GlxA family with amidase domain